MSTPHRREFLVRSSALLAGCAVPYFFSSVRSTAACFQARNDRPVLGCIGTGDRWDTVGPQALEFADCAAVCDVDKTHVEKGRSKVRRLQDKPEHARAVDMYEDYRRLLDRRDIDVVMILTPDHWHAKIAIEAMQAGKDVYCEKPLTLTIDEGKQILQVLKLTGRVFQVGTQQRTEFDQRFLKAVAIARAGRLGKITKVTCAIGGAPMSAKLPKAAVPGGLNWELWLGQAPLVDYVAGPGKTYPESRCHYEFRWWYEYSGGTLTDWGAHHVDIAQWAIGMERSGPTSVEGTAKHPVPLKAGHPLESDRYNAATEFLVKAHFPNGVEMTIRHDTENGILMEGTEGQLFVNRSKLTGDAVDALAAKPLPEDALTTLCKGKPPGSHLGNFFECLRDRSEPVSDVYTHHRAMTTCHLANIAIRLGRKIAWDPQAEQIVGDDEARQWQRREQRKGYEINVGRDGTG